MARTVPCIALGFRAAMDAAICRARCEGRPGHDFGDQAEAQGSGSGDPLLAPHEGPSQHVAQRHAAMKHPDGLE